MQARRGEVAQMVEQGTENPRVRGSIPFLATIFYIEERSRKDWSRIVKPRDGELSALAVGVVDQLRGGCVPFQDRGDAQLPATSD